MTGEMTTVDRSEYPTHFAIAAALGGEVKPFDVYQGPYILVGSEILTGESPYQMAVGNPTRLWITENSVYREDTDREVTCPIDIVDAAIDAARELMAD